MLEVNCKPIDLLKIRKANLAGSNGEFANRIEKRMIEIRDLNSSIIKNNEEILELEKAIEKLNDKEK